MPLIDPKFVRRPLPFLPQPLLGGLAVLLVLNFLNMLEHTALVAALGASTFIAYTRPCSRDATARHLIGGYIVGILCGSLCYSISRTPAVYHFLGDLHNARIIFGAVAVTLAIFFMVVTDAEHAPATAVALGFCLEKWYLQNVLFILAGIVVIYTVKRLMARTLFDLT